MKVPRMCPPSQFSVFTICISLFVCSSYATSYDVEFGKLNDPLKLSLIRPRGHKTFDPELPEGRAEQRISATAESSLKNLRERIRSKLASYANEVKLVHDLPSKDATSQRQRRHQDRSRIKRDTIQADELEPAGRSRRNNAAQAYELSYLDSELTHVVKRVYQLQKPSFSSVNVTDLNVLTSSGITYLVAVESHQEGIFTVFYKFTKTWDLEEIGRWETPEAVICEIFQIDGYNYVLPASYQPTNGTHSLDGGSPLYRVDFVPKFREIKVQSINTEFAKSISFWRSSGVEANDMILCVAPEKRWTARGYRYKVDISCYRWQGGYFDLTYLIPAYNPQAVSYTHIASNNYLCVANYQDDSGTTSIFSTIFKYSHKRGIYIPTQKIKTYGARDCQYFRFDSPEQIKEHYLAIANYGQVDSDGRINYNVKSYIFKFGMGRMILFQSLTTLGAFQILPIHDGPKFLLIVAEMHRISIYQHNGWNFVKTSNVDFPDVNLVNQFRMRPMLAYNQTYFTVATPKVPPHTGVYSLEFESKNDYIQMSSELEGWCLEAVANIQGTDLIKLTQDAISAPTTTQPEIITKSSLVFQSPLRTNAIFTQSLEYNGSRFDEQRSASLGKLESKLKALEADVRNLGATLDGAVTLSGSQTISTPLEFRQWNVANDSRIVSRDYTTIFINDVEVSKLLEKLIFLNKNYLLDRVDIKILDTTQEIQLQKLNGKLITDILLASSPNTQTLLENNVFLQNVVSQRGLLVAGHLNGVNVSNILTARGNQHFQEIRLRNSTVSNLEASNINGVRIVDAMNLAVPKIGAQEISGNKKFTRISTPFIRADKLLSGNDVNYIYNQAVNASNINEATFTGEPVFEAIKVDALHVKSNLLNGQYDLNKNFVSAVAPHLTFDGTRFNIFSNVKVANLDVKSNLNNIPIYNGRPDIVLKTLSHPAEHQRLWGQQLNSVRLENPAKLNGMINGIDMEKWSQVITIELNETTSPLTADIVGRKISFPQGLTVKRLTHAKYNTLEMVKKSIPLRSPNLPCLPKSITFENLHVSGNAQVNSINGGVSPSRDWISNRPVSEAYNSSTEPTLIQGRKHFFGDIVLLKPSTTSALHLSTDENADEIFSVLGLVLINGTHGKDQIISGNIIFNDTLKVYNLTTDHRHQNQIVLDNINFSDILLAHDHHHGHGQAVHVKSKFKNTVVAKKSLKIKSKLRASTINDIDIAAAIRDTLRTDNKYEGLQKVQGHLKFVGSFFLNDTKVGGTLGNYDVDELLGNVILKRAQKQLTPAPVRIVDVQYAGHNDDVETIKGSLTFAKGLQLSSLNFAKALNFEITPDSWGSSWMTKKGNQEITTPFHFRQSLSSNFPQVVNSRVSNVDLVRLNSEILRKDQDNFLDHATFKSPIFMESGSMCADLINNFDIKRDFLRKNSIHRQNVTGKKIFDRSNWEILGNLKSPRLANIDWEKLAQITVGPQSKTPDDKLQLENLHIVGDCESNLEPSIQKTPTSSVNGVPWRDILNSHWFRKENTSLAKTIRFMPRGNQSELSLAGGTIHGLVGGVALRQLEKEYLSISKNQDWTGNFTFHSQVCSREIIANDTTIKTGKLNGLNVNEFASSVLLDGPNQTFTTNGINIKYMSSHDSLRLTGKINGLDFCQDMISIHGHNHVRGLKEIDNLVAQKLRLSPQVRVNGVLLYEWERLAAKTGGDFRLSGNRHFHSARFNNLNVMRLVNNKKVNNETIMRLTGDQSGPGRLRMQADPATSPPTFSNVRIEGKLNGRSVKDYFSNLALVNGTEPIHVHGYKKIEGRTSTKWLKTENRYEQHGVDLMDFISNHNVKNYANKHSQVLLKEKYESINNMTVDLIHIASERAVLAKCFNRIGSINHNGIVSLKVAHNILNRPTIGVVVKEGDSGYQTISWLTYNPDANAYASSEIRDFTFYGKFRDLAQVERGNKNFLFVSVSSLNNTVVRSTSPVSPSSSDFFLTNQTAVGKLSKGYVLRLQNNPNKTSHALVHQVIFGDDIGNILSFRLKRAAGYEQECVLYSVLDKADFKGLVFCFNPLYSNAPVSNDDDALHFVQAIPLSKPPQLTSLMVDDKTTLIILSDGYRNNDGRLIPHNDVVNVWAHNYVGEAEGKLIYEDSFPVINIVGVDSIMAPNFHPFLAVVSGKLDTIGHFGLVYLYRYSNTKKRFVKYQTIQEKNPISARFLQLEPSNEVFLFILTGCGPENVNVYTFRGISGWNKEFSFTMEGAEILEPWDFILHSKYKAQLLTANSEQLNIIDFQLNGIPYIPSSSAYYDD